MIQYKVERRGSYLLVRLEIKGSKRLLYLDTLKSFAKKEDEEALFFLCQMHLRASKRSDTLLFDRIEVPMQHAKKALELMEKTGRFFDKDKEEEESFILLPELVLTESTGSFANLWMQYGKDKVAFFDFSPKAGKKIRQKKQEAQFEKDLLDAGFIKKEVGKSNYFCPKEKVKETLLLLLGLGWNVLDPLGEKVSKEIQILDKEDKIEIRSQIRAFIDHSIQMQGVWNQGVFLLEKTRAGALLPLLKEKESICWQDSILSCLEGLKEGALLPETPPSQRFKASLLPYQQKGVNWLFFLYRWGFSGLLSDEMGLGKTVQVLAFLSLLETNLPILIVAPTSLLFQWEMEIEKFLKEKGNIKLISYSTLRVQDFSNESFEVIVLDESNAIKTAKTQTAGAAYKLKGKLKICLSGTPMENRLEELGSQFRFLMPGLFKAPFCFSKEQIRPFLLRRKKEDVGLDLPEKQEMLCFVGMNEEQASFYEENRVSSLKEKGDALKKIMKLRQIANDPRLISEKGVGAKTEKVIQDIHEVLEEKRKVLVFSQFTSMLKLILQDFPGALYLDGSVAERKRKEIVESFQNEEGSSVFLLSLKAGGVGLNLTAADYIFLIDPWWNEAVEAQAIARAHRIGRKQTVMAKRYITLGSIEERILKLKEKKQEVADQVLDFEQEEFTEEELLYLLT